MKDTVTGRRTCFQQQRCTNRQRLGTSLRLAPFKLIFLVVFFSQACVYLELLLCAHVRVTHAVLPQGWYNLGLLAEEGFRLPLSVLAELGHSELYLANNSLLLSALYKRCAGTVYAYMVH